MGCRSPGRAAHGHADDIAPLAVYLSGKGSDYVTGQLIFVDGGYSTTGVGHSSPESPSRSRVDRWKFGSRPSAHSMDLPHGPGCRSSKPERCRKCGMALVAVSRSRRRFRSRCRSVRTRRDRASR